MARKQWTDAEVEMEICRLQQSDDVKLAKREQQIKYRRRQQMWNLQFMEKRGKQLRQMGITLENMEEMLFGDIPIDEDQAKLHAAYLLASSEMGCCDGTARYIQGSQNIQFPEHGCPCTYPGFDTGGTGQTDASHPQPGGRITEEGEVASEARQEANTGTAEVASETEA